MMSQQASLFDVPAYRRTDPPTSKAAAVSIDTTELEAIVLDAIRNHPAGLTSHEIASLTGIDLVTISPRCRPLVNKNLIVDSGFKRAGASRRNSIVWRAI